MLLDQLKRNRATTEPNAETALSDIKSKNLSHNRQSNLGFEMCYEFQAERLAYWYLRLNGFLTIENFILHPRTTGKQKTDIDLVGVRFPHRK